MTGIPALLFFCRKIFITRAKHQQTMRNQSHHPEECTCEFCEMSPDERENEIRLAAYYIWEKKGEKQGEDKEDWYEAEVSFHEDYSE